MLRINDLKLTPEQGKDKREERQFLKAKASKILRVGTDSIKSFKISKKSIDARDKHNIFYVYSVDVIVENKLGYIKNKRAAKFTVPEYKLTGNFEKMEKRPVVVGSGPAGLFAALILAEAGQEPIILERGKNVEARTADVERFFATGVLDAESNVQFGEGGAGTFSDGKLTTGIKDIRMTKVIKELIDCSAPEEIAYLAKPHIGTDILVRVMMQMRGKITALGGEFRFQNKLQKIVHKNDCLVGANVIGTDKKEYFIETDNLILAIGHSARDTFEMLNAGGFIMRPKAFAVGVRVEHKQQMINVSQFGKFAEHLPPADYKLTHRTSDGRGVYTFCMCPGGTVVAASSEENSIAVNGMSNYRRNGENANSAVVVSVSPSDFGTGALDGVNFQRKLETAAFKLGGSNYKAPIQQMGDFLNGVASTSIGAVTPSYQPGYTLCNLSDCLDSFIVEALQESFVAMEKKIKGFASPDAIVTAVESRSSSPVTIVRDDFMNSNIAGVVPCGEGAGYAGGIISAAVDGIRCAEMILSK